MIGLCRTFATCRALCRALSIVLGIAITLANAVPASPIHGGHVVNAYAQIFGTSLHADPADKNLQGHKTHSACNPGIGCFPVTVAAEEVSMFTPLSVTIERANVVRPVTRIVAPPLPPPKIIILA